MAKTPGMISQAGQLLNSILSDLCQDYDFDLAKGTYNFTLNPGLAPPANSPVVAGSGPYPMPDDFLRADYKDFFWTNQGVPYFPVALDPAEFDSTVQQAGNQSYPYWYTVDMSAVPPGLYLFPAPSGSFPAFMKYRRQMPDIATPETSATVPWFPNQNYLITRLTGEMCKLADDDRWQAMLSEGEHGAAGILNRYLKLVDDHSTRSRTVKLDRRRFGSNYNTLPNTKVIGW